MNAWYSREHEALHFGSLYLDDDCNKNGSNININV